MIQDGTADSMLAPGRAERIGVSVPTFAAGDAQFPAIAQMGVRVHAGQVVVRLPHALPVVDGKTAIGDFLEFHADKYPPDLLADPGPSSGTLSDAVLVIGIDNYYHFFANHFPALLLLRAIDTPRVRLLTLYDFPATVTPLITEILPYIAGGRPVDVVKVSSGTFDAANVVFPTRSHIDMPALLARRILLPHVFDKAGGDPMVKLGPLKLFVRRANSANGRNLLNPRKVENWFTARGYTPVDPGTLSFTEQVLVFARASHIAGIEGAAMTNVIFAPHLRQVVMLASPYTRDDRFFQHLVEGYGIAFHALYGDAVGLARNADYVMPLIALDALPPEASADQ